jgi:hypothetical protein
MGRSRGRSGALRGRLTEERAPECANVAPGKSRPYQLRSCSSRRATLKAVRRLIDRTERKTRENKNGLVYSLFALLYHMRRGWWSREIPS